MKFRKLTYLAFAFSIPYFLQAQQAKMNIGVEAGQLNFSVSFKGQPVILSSPLGMNVDNQLLGKEVKSSTANTTSGKYKTYTIEKKDGSIYYIDSWEFDDGVALRYRIPSDGPVAFTVNKQPTLSHQAHTYGMPVAHSNMDGYNPIKTGIPMPSKTNCWLLLPHSFCRTEPMPPSQKPIFSTFTGLFYSAKKTTVYSLAM